jgi:hypothetical protein
MRGDADRRSLRGRCGAYAVARQFLVPSRPERSSAVAAGRSRSPWLSGPPPFVSDFKRDDIAAEIAELTNGRGVDLVFDATYSEQSFVETAKTVRRGGRWIVLGVGPGKTTRLAETASPVDAILAERGAKHVNINLLRYFSELATLDSEARGFLERGNGPGDGVGDLWSRRSARPSTAPLRRSTQDCSR